ncbi:MAG: crosslink repair DNA glycosylase YcaQ family protein [Anaerolineae bacterium]|nr:crosslink repair DNA glycosylase YcaQ family protein [Anaerolineae bacterium]MDQ7036288.1 crosslink repair DNA glycosylase YcaQ family protein [Anaerolineae bacterium]
MTAIREISPDIARRFIISKQHLDNAPRPSMLEVIRDLGCLQLDPISKVLQPHWLILLSRLGQYERAELDKLRWEDRKLFEYWAHAASLVLTEDYPIHAVHMRESWGAKKLQKWMNEHDLHNLRQHMLERLREEGALSPADFNDEQMTNESFSGWANGRAANRLMERMWTIGDVMVVERKGTGRKWDLAERFFPEWTPREEIDTYEATYRSMQRAVKALGVTNGRKQINYAFTRGRYWHFKDVMQQLLDEKVLIPVKITAWAGDWMMHKDDLPLLEKIESGDWQPKTTLLSPFDPLICDRDRTELIWDFRYRIAIYVPKDKRDYGYYVLPILHGDKLIGRMDMAFDKKAKILTVISTYAQANAPSAVRAIRGAVQSLATFLGATDITYGETMPKIWKALRK